MVDGIQTLGLGMLSRPSNDNLENPWRLINVFFV
jgi:hypothetical protein